MKQNWTYKKLGEVCETTSGGTPSKDHKEYYEGGTIPWLRSGEVANRCITETELSITQEGVENSSAKLVPINSVVVAMYGATVGQVGILKMQTTTNQAVCSILPNDSIMPEFLYYTLVAHKKIYLEQAVGGAQPNISQQIIKNTTIPVPPLAEQQRIVSELDLLQGIIDKQQAQLKELATLAQSIFYDMFGDPVANEKGWEVKRLGEVCNVGSSRRIFAEEYVNDGIPFYRSKEIIELSKKQPISVELFISEKRYNEIKENNGMPSIGDLLITAVGTIGEIWIVDSDKPFYFKDGNIVWLSKIQASINPLYFQYVLQKLIDEYKKKMAIGSAYSALTIVNLKKLGVPVPPLSLQQEFAEKIEKIERQKTAISQSLAETRKLFDYTMDKYFG